MHMRYHPGLWMCPVAYSAPWHCARGTLGGTPSGSAIDPPPPQVLLTGATGFLGAYLLCHVLAIRPRTHVVCLVRAADGDAAKIRVATNLDKYGLKIPTGEGRGEDGGCVSYVCGDVSQPRLGLEDAVYATLARTVTSVYHCASLVHYAHTYAALEQANVVGTANILQFCVDGRKSARKSLYCARTTEYSITHRLGTIVTKSFSLVKRFSQNAIFWVEVGAYERIVHCRHHISTLGVFPVAQFHTETITEASVIATDGAIATGYSQSKFVADALVRKFASRYEIWYFRPSLLLQFVFCISNQREAQVQKSYPDQQFFLLLCRGLRETMLEVI